MSDTSPYECLEEMARATMHLVPDEDHFVLAAFDFEVDPVAISLDVAPFRPGQLDDPSLFRRVEAPADLQERLSALGVAFRATAASRAAADSRPSVTQALTLRVFADGTFSFGTTSRDR